MYSRLRGPKAAPGDKGTVKGAALLNMLNPNAAPFVPRCPPPSPASGAMTPSSGLMSPAFDPKASPGRAAFPAGELSAALAAIRAPDFPQECSPHCYRRELKWAVRNAAAPGEVFDRCLARLDSLEFCWEREPARLPNGAGAFRAVDLIARGATDDRIESAVAKIQRAWRRREKNSLCRGARSTQEVIGGWGPEGMSAREKMLATRNAAARARRLAPLADTHKRWRPQV